MKALPIAGIVGSVFAALAIAVFVPDSMAMFVPLLVGLAGSGILVGQRTMWGVVCGLVLLVLTVVAALGLVGNVSTEDGETNFGVGVATGQVLAVVICLGLPLAAIGLRWDDAEPRWLAIAASVVAVVALLIVVSDPGAIGDQSQVKTIVAAVLALLSLAGMVPLLRAADEDEGVPARPVPAEPAPLVTAETALGKPAAPPAKKPVSPGRRP